MTARLRFLLPCAAAHSKQKFEVKPQGYGAKEDSALSPRKKRIVDWRDAQPSAVLPAGFRQTANQVRYALQTSCLP